MKTLKSIAMKNLLLLFLLLPLFTFAQEYSEVIEVPGKTADKLYTISREWFAETFNSANNVLQMDDPVAGKLIGKGSTHVSESYVVAGFIKVPVTINWYPNFTIKVSVKDGRYKCDITDITIKRPGSIIGDTSFPATEVPFNDYLGQKEYNKNACDPEWLINNPPPGVKMNKSKAKNLTQSYQSMYNLTVKTEDEINSIMDRLQQKMKTTEDNW